MGRRSPPTGSKLHCTKDSRLPSLPEDCDRFAPRIQNRKTSSSQVIEPPFPSSPLIGIHRHHPPPPELGKSEKAKNNNKTKTEKRPEGAPSYHDESTDEEDAAARGSRRATKRRRRASLLDEYSPVAVASQGGVGGTSRYARRGSRVGLGLGLQRSSLPRAA